MKTISKYVTSYASKEEAETVQAKIAMYRLLEIEVESIREENKKLKERIRMLEADNNLYRTEFERVTEEKRQAVKWLRGRYTIGEEE